MPRFYCPIPLTVGTTLDLPASAARHVQVLRLQPSGEITLFNGDGGEHSATVTRMGRSDVQVTILAHHAVEREATTAVHLAVGMPANDRMDWLVEKATELGVTSIQPLMTAHSVLRLKGERADRKQAHWHSVAVAACEQCGRNRVPTIHPVADLADWLARTSMAPPDRGSSANKPALHCVLSLAENTRPFGELLGRGGNVQIPLFFLSGPEGGLSCDEDALARAMGWQAISLGTRVLRAETAAITALICALH